MKNYILKINCKDKPGIISSVSNFLFKNKFNILESSQFRDTRNNNFFMRVHFKSIDNTIETNGINLIEKKFSSISKKFKMNFFFYNNIKKQNILIMVSKFGHCLNHILFQWKTNNLNVNIPCIVSNHTDMKEIVEHYGIKYEYMPISKNNKLNKEKALYTIIKKYKIDLIVLARYMQVLSPNLCKKLQGKIINIHHSFLPSFKGARPYHQAYKKGVKIIGATAHYVTDELDEGQIIEQDVGRVDHTKSLQDFVSMGRDIENVVLTRAIKWHIQHRIIINKNSTIVFN
ncbi:MAG: Formyltetrahydrofolate deformylase [Alphaproteobacteria bacterium MarineAlpha9_Bin4]|nr:MAG: Formyltetrahydrofolate deformylase [Alphaproteobacteria bacterium MarineAlpha9_Bin4]